MAAFGGDRRARQTCGSAADHGYALLLPGFSIDKLAFPARPRIDHATRRLADEVMIEASLVAGDADIDAGAVARPGLVREVGVGEHGAREGHHVRVAAREEIF